MNKGKIAVLFLKQTNNCFRKYTPNQTKLSQLQVLISKHIYIVCPEDKKPSKMLIILSDKSYPPKKEFKIRKLSVKKMKFDNFFVFWVLPNYLK